MGQTSNERWERDKIISAMADPFDLLCSIMKLLKERQQIAKEFYNNRHHYSEDNYKIMSEFLDIHNDKLAIILGLISPESKLKNDNEKS